MASPEDGVPLRVRFGVFEADFGTRELRKSGSRIRLQEQPFQVLAVLIERRGEIVSRDELRNRLWNADTFVDFDHGLNKAINKIRETLGDSAASPRFVETVARRGYRFIADVSVIQPDGPVMEALVAAPVILSAPDLHTGTAVLEPSPVEAVNAAPLSRVAAGRRRSRTALLAAVILLATIAVGLVALRTFTTRATPAIRSLAVLPLESLSGDASQDYFADGMTDELIATLGQISALRVISRTSAMTFKHTNKLLPEIARELNVDAVVEGSVMRADGQVRITAQLIDARDDRHLWAETYQGDLRDTLTLQHNVARAIARQIQVNVAPREEATLTSAHAVDPDAYEAYLKGRYFWNKRTAEGLKTAKDYFDQAIARDPGYAPAYSGLADTYALLGDWQYAVMTPAEALPLAKAAATKALELDGTLGEAHISLAFCLEGFDWDFAAADREFARGVELNPGYATGRHWNAWHLILRGHPREALAEMKKAETLDPLSLIINADLAELFAIAHFSEQAVAQARKTIEMEPNFGLAHNQLGQAYLQEGKIDQAVAELEIAVRDSDGSPTCTANLARAYAAAGRRADATRLLTTLRSRSTATHSNAPEIASVYAALGDHDAAMTWLEQGYAERFNPGVLIRPAFDPLRADPRFKALVERVGLAH